MIAIDQAEFAVAWTCSRCGCRANIDYFDLTAFPCCENCCATEDWRDILTEDKYNHLNELLALTDRSV